MSPKVGLVTKLDMVRSHVETLLERMLRIERASADADGDYPVRYQNALYFVRLVGYDQPVVQVFSIAVAGVEKSPELLDALNEINTELRFARAMWIRNQILIESDHLGETLEAQDFVNACNIVAGATDEYAPRLAASFGGKTAFEDEKDGGYEPPPTPKHTGYL